MMMEQLNIVGNIKIFKYQQTCRTLSFGLCKVADSDADAVL